MRSLIVFICLAAALAASCVPNCNKVTGPNDIPYTLITDPVCFSCGSGNNYGGYLINSASDFNVLCPGGAVPASWDMVNKTYIVICTCETAHEPYLAGVGTDPADANQILVTVGMPCHRGMEPQMIVNKTFTLETVKTAKMLKVVDKNE